MTELSKFGLFMVEKLQPSLTIIVSLNRNRSSDLLHCFDQVFRLTGNIQVFIILKTKILDLFKKIKRL